MNKKLVQVIIHIAAWGCFLMLPLVFFPRPKDSPFLPDQAFSLFFLLSNFFYIAFYYFNSLWLIPKFLERRKPAVYIIIIVALLIFFGAFPRLYQYFFGDFQRFSSNLQMLRPRNSRRPLLSPGSISIFLLVFIFSTGIKVISLWLNTERRNKEIQNEKLQTELSFLKAQINPHFLFNTLNNIYALAASGSSQTAPSIMKLSSIMRYVLTETKHDTVPLEKEIAFITHYIELQKMRMTDKTSINFSINGSPQGKMISPLILLPFVENAFKYGISTREPSPIVIVFNIRDRELQVEVKNNKHMLSASMASENTGIGINNTKRRLDLLYPEKYALEIKDTAGSYTVNLNIELSCSAA